jgi:hypothetical protein
MRKIDLVDVGDGGGRENRRERLSRLFPQRDHVVAGLVSRRRRSRLWAAHMNPSVTTGFRS